MSQHLTLRDLERDHSDVVLAAASVRSLHQRLESYADVLAVPLDELEDLALSHHVGEPVGAEEKDVAGLGRDRESVDVDVGVRAQGAGDDGALRMGRSEEHTSELQSQSNLVCRLLLEK